MANQAGHARQPLPAADHVVTQTRLADPETVVAKVRAGLALEQEVVDSVLVADWGTQD